MPKTQNKKSNFKKNKVGILSLSNFKPYHKVNKIRYCYQDSVVRIRVDI